MVGQSEVVVGADHDHLLAVYGNDRVLRRVDYPEKTGIFLPAAAPLRW
jgi:hypothetical protein